MDGIGESYIRLAFLRQRHGMTRRDMPEWMRVICAEAGFAMDDEAVWIRLDATTAEGDETVELCPACVLAFVRLVRLADGAGRSVHVGRHDACGLTFLAP
jgi:hypothetical protein